MTVTLFLVKLMLIESLGFVKNQEQGSGPYLRIQQFVDGPDIPNQDEQFTLRTWEIVPLVVLDIIFQQKQSEVTKDMF